MTVMGTEPYIVCRQGSALFAATPGTADAIARIPSGKLATITIKRPRSLAWQRRYWLLLSMVAPNTEHDVEQLHIVIKLKAGMVKEIREKNGKVWLVADSTAFDVMDGVEWSKFWDKAVDIILSEYLPITRAELENEVAALCGVPSGLVP